MKTIDFIRDIKKTVTDCYIVLNETPFDFNKPATTPTDIITRQKAFDIAVRLDGDDLLVVNTNSQTFSVKKPLSEDALKIVIQYVSTGPKERGEFNAIKVDNYWLLLDDDLARDIRKTDSYLAK